MSFIDFMSSIIKNEREGSIMKNVMLSLVTSLLIVAVLYYSGAIDREFFSKYSFFLFFAILSYAFIFGSIKYIRAWGALSCTSGMMVGMTLGMTAGFLPGIIIGATNGMFIGGIFGVIIGGILGIWSGKCCGIMGIMEGMMAAFMGGLMGAMTAVMTLNDHLRLMVIFVFFINLIILFGLNYLVFKETKQSSFNKTDSFEVIFLSMIITALTISLMAFGPRSFVL